MSNGVFATSERGKNPQEHISTCNMKINGKNRVCVMKFHDMDIFSKAQCKYVPYIQGQYVYIYPILWAGSEWFMFIFDI
jgi:hypothetical protein